MQLRGCGTALITPFHPDGGLDEAALTRHVEWQVNSGITLLIPAGTTGEASTLTEDEWIRVVELTVQAADGRALVFAGATHNSTQEAVARAKRVAKVVGLDGILTANPYYNRPGQEGQYQHFRAIAEAANLPVLLYNIPGRTGTNLLPETVLRLAEIENVVGVKESSGNMPQIIELLTRVPEGFAVFAGDDSMALPSIAVGGAGLVSVASNAIPQQMSAMVDAALSGDWKKANEINRKHYRFMQSNFAEPSPAPIKAVMAHMGRCDETLRLPMVPVSQQTREMLRSGMQDIGL